MSNEQIIDFLYERAVISAATQEPRTSIHVSDLTQDCTRKAAYRLRGFSPEPLSFKQAVPLIHGTALHEKIDLGGQNEVPVESSFYTLTKAMNDGAKGIYDKVTVKGTIDDIVQIDDELILCDKKTTAKSIPKKIPSQYQWQLNIYKLLYFRQTGIDIKRGAIVWIDKSSGWKVHRTSIIDLLPNEKILDFVRDKLQLLQRKALPSRVITPLCNYCPHLKRCKPFG